MTQDSTLAHLCRRDGLPVEEFESFETVAAALMDGVEQGA